MCHGDKILKNSKQIIPSEREMVLPSAFISSVSKKRTMRMVEIRSRSGSSLEIVSFLIFIGKIRAPMPISSRMLVILLPMTLPSSISVVPLMSEEMETASSGAPVPKAIMVSPINIFDTLKCEAAEEAPSINQSAPFIKMMNPTMRSIVCNIISICLC